MARIRTIKPEFWTSEQVVSCVMQARLLFIGMWNFSDDNGVHPKSCKRLRMEIFPDDNCSLEDISDWVNQLLSANLIMEYKIDDKEYWLITGFKQHQRIEKPTYKFPLPFVADGSPTSARVVEEDSTSPRQIVLEESAKDIQPFTDELRTPLPGNVMERNVMDIDKNKVSDETSDNVLQIFQHWQQVLKHPKAKLDISRKKKIIFAIKLGFSVAELKKAIDGCAKSEWHMGKNNANKKYDEINLIFRDAEHIEKFINYSVSASDIDDVVRLVSQLDQIAQGAI